ncbi:MAG: hypothetical protein KC423_00120 [Anaerolineales bacterium]|nr:hypothetical protein [Anaerolineales bacterium]
MRTQYRAYLLRLRRSESQRHWRATLEDAHTGEHLQFASQNELLRYLLHSLSDQSPNEPPPQLSNKADG